MFRKSAPKSSLTPVIEELLENMLLTDTASPEYAVMADQLVKIHPLQSTTDRRISPDTLATVAANLFGILIIVGYEQKHLIGSKALGFISKIH